MIYLVCLVQYPPPPSTPPPNFGPRILILRSTIIRCGYVISRNVWTESHVILQILFKWEKIGSRIKILRNSIFYNWRIADGAAVVGKSILVANQWLDHRWFPRKRGNSLYLREDHLRYFLQRPYHFLCRSLWRDKGIKWNYFHCLSSLQIILIKL